MTETAHSALRPSEDRTVMPFCGLFLGRWCCLVSSVLFMRNIDSILVPYNLLIFLLPEKFAFRQFASIAAKLSPPPVSDSGVLPADSVPSAPSSGDGRPERREAGGGRGRIGAQSRHRALTPAQTGGRGAGESGCTTADTSPPERREQRSSCHELVGWFISSSPLA